MGKGRAAGRVGSGQTFCQQSRVGSGQVGSTFRRVGSGPRKVTRGQLCVGSIYNQWKGMRVNFSPSRTIAVLRIDPVPAYSLAMNSQAKCICQWSSV